MVQNIQGILTKRIVDFLRDGRSNTLDLSGSQVANDAFLGMRDHFLIVLHFKLQTMSRMLDPVTAELVAKVFCSGKTIADSFDLADHLTVYILHNATGTVNCDHVIYGRDICCLGINELMKLA